MLLARRLNIARPPRLRAPRTAAAAHMDSTDTSWQSRLISDDRAQIAQLLKSSKRIAVLGIKTEQQANQPSFYVAEYLHQQPGMDVIPVPVYYPEVTQILGKPVYRRLQDVPGPIDIVDVFRRGSDVPGHVEDILACKPLPRAVWLQSGIRNEEAEQRLARHGILVVADRCLLVDHQSLSKL